MRRASPSDMDDATMALDPEAVEAAKSAIARGCEEALRLSSLFAKTLEKIDDVDLHKFARALALCQMGYLPTKPEDCPFCLKYSQVQCRGCGYARTHGSCEDQLSAFSQFIEAFADLGRAIYQDTSSLMVPPAQARSILQSSISASSHGARDLLRDLPAASGRELMELKAAYLKRAIDLLPTSLLHPEVDKRRSLVMERLKNYW